MVFTLNFFCLTLYNHIRSSTIKQNIKIDNKSIYLSEISEKGLNCIGHLFNERQKLKTWDELEQEYNFHEYKNFLFMQLLYPIHKSWKNNLSGYPQSRFTGSSFNKKKITCIF